MTSTAIEVRDKLKSKAKEWDARMRNIGKVLRRAWADIGEICAEFRDRELYRLLGFDRFEDWGTDVGIRRSTRYAAMRCHDALKKLPRADRLAMTKENAEWLSRLPESKRFTDHWVGRAKNMKEEEFSELVNDALPGAAKVEALVCLKIYMAKSQKKYIEEVIKEWARNNELGDKYGRALELICAEANNDQDGEINHKRKVALEWMAANFKGTLRLVREMNQVFHSPVLSNDQIVGQAKEQLERLVELLAAVVEPKKVSALRE